MKKTFLSIWIADRNRGSRYCVELYLLMLPLHIRLSSYSRGITLFSSNGYSYIKCTHQARRFPRPMKSPCSIPFSDLSFRWDAPFQLEVCKTVRPSFTVDPSRPVLTKVQLYAGTSLISNCIAACFVALLSSILRRRALSYST